MNLILDILGFFLLATIPAAFNYFLDYCLGHPMSEDKVSTKAIFFRYSYWLAKRRLTTEKHKDIVVAFAPMLNSEDEETREQGKDQMKLTIMTAGRKLFFYEQAFGMCPYCTNFWCSQITATVLFLTITPIVFHPLFFFLIIPIFSHSILRKL